MAIIDTTMIQIAKTSQWPKCLSKKWLKCLSEENSFKLGKHCLSQNLKLWWNIWSWVYFMSSWYVDKHVLVQCNGIYFTTKGD